jgi:methionyl-tRNA formyltransferase
MNVAQRRIVFFGNERLATGVTTAAPTLRALLNASYQIAAVVSHFEGGKSRNARRLEIAAIADANGIPLLLPHKPADILEDLRGMQADIGVLVAYGRIVPQEIIDLFPHGIVNIHPSLLPLHRGPTPIESVILSGAIETGVSIMKLAKAMDAGPVYDQTTVTLRGGEPKQELADLLLDHGKNMLIEILPGILDGSMISHPQDEAAATYDQLITKEDGLLDFSKPAEQLAREVRAYALWPKSRMVLQNKVLSVTEAHVEPKNGGKTGTIWLEHKRFGVFCGQDSLVIDRIIPAGKQEMAAEGFVAGYRHLLQQ